ncbi:MAG: alcohol dehydrogenase catalytic domain-containing protein, partial [Rhodospirillaceae bacterium]
EVRRVSIAKLERGDVLVRVMASGLCHTDLEVIEGSLAYPMPIILGHEGAGVVEAVGGDVSAVKPGDHVVCSWNPHCGHCFYCERDQPILCEPFTFNQPHWTKEDLAKITVPTWIVDADHDEAIYRENTELMAGAIPRAGLLLKPEVIHFSMLQDPAQFTADILRFLGRTW